MIQGVIRAQYIVVSVESCDTFVMVISTAPAWIHDLSLDNFFSLVVCAGKYFKPLGHKIYDREQGLMYE